MTDGSNTNEYVDDIISAAVVGADDDSGKDDGVDDDECNEKDNTDVDSDDDAKDGNDGCNGGGGNGDDSTDIAESGNADNEDDWKEWMTDWGLPEMFFSDTLETVNNALKPFLRTISSELNRTHRIWSAVRLIPAVLPQ